VLTALGAVGLAAGLAACSGQPGAAAVVDGRAIPVSDVQDAQTELSPFFQGVTPSAMLAVLVQEPVLRAFLEEEDAGISQDQAETALSQLVEQSGGDPDAQFSEASRAVVRYTLEYSALQQLGTSADIEKFTQALTDLDLQVSPRFGSVDTGNVISPTTYPWIVLATDAASS
jgi:hypothetical protein